MSGHINEFVSAWKGKEEPVQHNQGLSKFSQVFWLFIGQWCATWNMLQFLLESGACPGFVLRSLKHKISSVLLC